MSLTISREQRDAIYELVVDHLSGIGDVWIELNNRDPATSKRLARAFVEDLHLLNDLGWDETLDSERVTLTMAPGELVRTLAWLHREAAGALRTYVSRPTTRGARGPQRHSIISPGRAPKPTRHRAAPSRRGGRR